MLEKRLKELGYKDIYDFLSDYIHEDKRQSLEAYGVNNVKKLSDDSLVQILDKAILYYMSLGQAQRNEGQRQIALKKESLASQAKRYFVGKGNPSESKAYHKDSAPPLSKGPSDTISRPKRTKRRKKTQNSSTAIRNLEPRLLLFCAFALTVVVFLCILLFRRTSSPSQGEQSSENLAENYKDHPGTGVTTSTSEIEEGSAENDTDSISNAIGPAAAITDSSRMETSDINVMEAADDNETEYDTGKGPGYPAAPTRATSETRDYRTFPGTEATVPVLKQDTESTVSPLAQNAESTVPVLEQDFGNDPSSMPQGTKDSPYPPISQETEDSPYPQVSPEILDSMQIEDLKRYAETGNAAAQNILGNRYYAGQGIEQDFSAALNCYSAAAEQQYAPGQYNLGYMFEHGKGVKQDYGEAFYWYTLSAEQGYDVAQNNLALLYELGYGTAQDYEKAHAWYQAAAEQGNQDAERALTREPFRSWEKGEQNEEQINP